MRTLTVVLFAGFLATVLTAHADSLFTSAAARDGTLISEKRAKIEVGDIIAQLQKGRHTTTTAELLALDVGGYVVDTPGIRSFDIAGVPLGELEMHFVEFAEHLADCKFADCTHIHEPSCSVRAAVKAGHIHSDRYESYARMYTERAGSPGERG